MAFGNLGSLEQGFGLLGLLDGESRLTPAFNSLIAFMGDSQTANGISVSGVDTTYQGGAGFAPHLLTTIGNVLRMPVGGNKGISGQTTTQMLARFNADILGLSPLPSVVMIEGGINGTVGAVEAANILTMAQRANAAGILAVLTTILPTFSPATPNLSNSERLIANALIRSYAGTNIVVADAAALSWVTGDFADGLHVNSGGADKWGRSIASALLPRLTTGNVLGLLTSTWNNNLSLAGTNGTPAGMPTNFTLDTSLAGGATVVVSKDVDGGLLVTVSGNYTGNSREVFLYSVQAGGPASGDTFEAIAKMQLLADTTNVASYTMYGLAINSGFADVGTSIDAVTGIVAADGAVYLRGPSVVTSGVAGFIRKELHINFPNAASSTPISIQFKLFGIGNQKVN